MEAIIVLGLVIFFVFHFVSKKSDNEEIIYSHDNVSILHIRSKFKTVISKLKSILLPKVAQEAQLKINPNKKQVIREMGATGELNEIIKEKIDFINSDINDLVMEIFDFAFFEATTQEMMFDVLIYKEEVREQKLNEIKNGFVNYLKMNSSLFSDLQHKITEEFRLTAILLYDDNQIDDLITKLSSMTKQELYKQKNKITNDRINHM